MTIPFAVLRRLGLGEEIGDLARRLFQGCRSCLIDLLQYGENLRLQSVGRHEMSIGVGGQVKTVWDGQAGSCEPGQRLNLR